MRHYLLHIALLCTLFVSCTENDSDDQLVERLPVIGLVNWTGHWDALCSPGENLTFSITHEGKNQRFEIEADSGAAFNADLKEGDLIKIVVLNNNGDVIHSRSKNFEPSNPERPARGLDMTPVITVCQIDRLDVEGF